MKRIILCLGIFGWLIEVASARDLGQWDAANPEIREWYQALMQPDVPSASCCGEADAYWADEVHVRDGKTYAIITDDRPDEPRGRPHVDIGTEIEIPSNNAHSHIRHSSLGPNEKSGLERSFSALNSSGNRGPVF